MPAGAAKQSRWRRVEAASDSLAVASPGEQPVVAALKVSELQSGGEITGPCATDGRPGADVSLGCAEQVLIPPQMNGGASHKARRREGRGGIGSGRGSQGTLPYPAVGETRLAVPGFAAGVQAEYARRYAADLERVQQLLPETARWMDSHCHLESILARTWRGGGKPQVLASEALVDVYGLVASWPAGLDGCICNCVFRRLSKPDARVSEWGWIDENLHIFAIASSVSHRLWFTIGLHPHDADNWDSAAERKVRDMCVHPKCVAIGECGLDFFKHGRDEAEKQLRAFRGQVQLAVELNKPLVVHARRAEDLCMQVLSDLVPRHHPIHIHCYSDSVRHALQLCEQWENLRIGFTGSITFLPKNRPKGGGKAKAKIDSQLEGPEHTWDLLRCIPLSRMLIETDGPYMCPEPFRGQTAHPGHVHRVAEKIAEVKGVPLLEVMEATRESCRVVYGI